MEVPAEPVGPQAWYAPAIVSGQLPSLTVEVVPSRMTTAQRPLVPAPIPRRAGLTSWCRGEMAWRLLDHGGARWWSVWWQALEHPR